MSIDRRSFLENAAFALAAAKMMPHDSGASTHNAMPPAAPDQKKAYGSGYFGEWIQDEFGLPASHYTCDQINDPRAKADVKSRHFGRDRTHSSGWEWSGHCVELRPRSRAPG